jgi:fibronectin type 3 domain-containing protein
MFKKFIFIFHLSLFTSVCIAQTEAKKPVALVARSYADHIVLRYFATSPSLFNTANKVGYVIEKAPIAIGADGTSPEKLSYVAIKESPFKRWKDEQWETALKNLKLSDSTELKLAGLAMALTDSSAKPRGGDVMEDGLKSLKEQRDNADMKFGFALIAANRSKAAAEGLALRVTDQEVVMGKTYMYRIRINQPMEDAKNTWTYLKIKCQTFDENYLKNNKAISLIEGDKNVSFSFPESDEYYAFNVERSDDNGNTYKRITGVPSLKLKPHGYTGKTDYGFADSNLINYKKYYYRILVSTLFADELLLSSFAATPTDKTPPPIPFLKSAEHTKPNQVELTWEMTGNETSDLKGFAIKRSNEEKGIYTSIAKNILPPSSRKFVDENFNKEGSNYYVVEAIDTAGNVSRSFPAYVTLIDSTPPAAPVVATAFIDSMGKVIIHIKPNAEKDFMGYQVLKANAADHEFSVVEETFKDSLGSTTFVVYDSTTLNTLTKNIFYKLIAFDTHFNQSEPSKIIQLKRRDTIPPVSPLITDFVITDSSVVLTFVNSGSEDVVRNILLRKLKGKETYDSIFSNRDTSITTFTDKKIISGSQYEYAMIAKDDGGLTSKISNTIVLKTLKDNRLPAPTITASYDPNTKKISLSFIVDEKLKDRKLKIEIYKRTDKNATWNAFKNIVFERGKVFLDEPANAQKSIMYIVRLLDENNRSSNFSNEIELKF